jgi:hypothetical protein
MAEPRQAGDAFREAEVLSHMARDALRRREAESAGASSRKSLAVFRQHRERNQIAWAVLLVDASERAARRFEAARAAFCEALKLFVGMASCLWMAVALAGVGGIAVDLGSLLMVRLLALPFAAARNPGKTKFANRQGREPWRASNPQHRPGLHTWTYGHQRIENSDDQSGWNVMFDMDGETARATRLAMPDRVEAEGLTVAARHFPEPGFGPAGGAAGRPALLAIPLMS